jgi:hypothetical protein
MDLERALEFGACVLAIAIYLIIWTIKLGLICVLMYIGFNLIDDFINFIRRK